MEQKHVSRLELGKSYPTIERLERIAGALDVPLKEFFDFMHLDNPDSRTEELEQLVKGMSEEYQRIIYKIVRAFET